MAKNERPRIVEPTPMTPQEVRAARHALGLTLVQLGELLELEGGYAGDTVRSWENGRRPISGPARVAIRLLLERAGLGGNATPAASSILEPRLTG